MPISCGLSAPNMTTWLRLSITGNSTTSVWLNVSTDRMTLSSTVTPAIRSAISSIKLAQLVTMMPSPGWVPATNNVLVVPQSVLHGAQVSTVTVSPTEQPAIRAATVAVAAPI